MRLILIAMAAAIASCSSDVIIVEAKPSQITLHWKDSRGVPLKSFPNLFSNYKNLSFATNGGMFGTSIENEPLGLYVENGKMLRPVKKVNDSNYNFGMQPQSVFIVTKNNVAMVVPVTDDAVYRDDIKYAVESAPMLVVGEKINPLLTKSSSANTRNGVGILKNGNVIIIVNRSRVTFQEFAKQFIDRGCTSAMYLDGAISNGLTPATASFDRCQCYGSFIGVTN